MVERARIYAAVSTEELDLLYAPATQRELADLGELVVAGGSGPVEVPAGVADEYDVLITSWSTATFPPDRLRGSRLRLAVHSAGSVRKLFPREVLMDGRLRLAQGGSDAMALPVAELAVTLTLALLRNLHTHDRGLQRTRDWFAGGNGLLGNGIAHQRIGVVGLSRTGRHYVRMVRGLGATDVVAYDPYATPAEAAALGVELTDLAALCRGVDVLAVHAPATPETRHLVSREMLALLPDGAVVVNTARSAVVDEPALTDELVAGRLRAGLDVFDEEPLPPTSPLLGLPNVILTPHVAGGTVEARFAQGATVLREVAGFLTDGTLRFEVTADGYDRLA